MKCSGWMSDTTNWIFAVKTFQKFFSLRGREGLSDRDFQLASRSPDGDGNEHKIVVFVVNVAFGHVVEIPVRNDV